MTLPQYGQPIVRTPPDDLVDLTGVAIESPAEGDLLVYDGAVWRNRPDLDVLSLLATTKPITIVGVGRLWFEADNTLHFLAGDGTEQIIGGTSSVKSYSLANPGMAGTFYVGGFYNFSAADVTLTIGGTVTQTFGSAQDAHGAHAFIVASGAGGADLVLTVSGISITDAGVRNDADSEVLVADADQAVLNQYFETTKKWLGQVTFTLTGAAGSFTFNYGFAKYDDFGNMDFTVVDFEGTGLMRANESGLNIELLHHEPTAFLYSAAAFVPNQTPVVSLADDYGVNNNVSNGDNFAYKRSGLSETVQGGNGEGVIIRVTTSTNNSINDGSFHIGVNLG